MVFVYSNKISQRKDDIVDHPFGETPEYVVIVDKTCVIINLTLVIFVALYLMRCS